MPTSNKGGGSSSKSPRQRALKTVAAKSPAPISDVGMETRRPQRAPYGQSLPNSVHPHIATPAEVARTRNRKDPAVGIAKAVKADVSAVAPVFRLNVGPGGYTGGKPTSESAVVPEKLVKNTVKSVAKDVTDPSHHKLNLALDVASLLSVGAGTAGRAIKAERAVREGEGLRGVGRAIKERPLPQEVLPRRLVGDKETGTRRIRVEGGHVQPPHQSPSIPTAAAQHGFDRLSEKVPNAPLVGAKARARRIIPEAQGRRDQRIVGELGDLQHASRTIRTGRRGTVTAKEAAYSAIADFGHGPQGVKLLDADIARREQRIADIPKEIAQLKDKKKADRLEHELKTQRARVEAWRAARPFVEAPENHPDLQRALVLGEAASKDVAASRVRRGAVGPQTAKEAPHRKARIASGATFRHAETPRTLLEPSREGTVIGRSRSVVRERTLGEAEKRLAKLDKTYEAAVKKITPHVDPYQGESNVMDINGRMRSVKQEEQRFRNMKSGKGGSGARYHEKQKSVGDEARALAEAKLDELAAKHPEQQFAKDIAERDRLREAINEHKLNDLGPTKPRSRYSLRPLEQGGHFFNQEGDRFSSKVAELSKPYDHMEHLNLHDEHGNLVGTMAYDARPDRKRIYVESIYVDPKHRGSTEALRELTRPLFADKRPIDAEFRNEKLGRLFGKLVERGRRDGGAGPVSSAPVSFGKVSDIVPGKPRSVQIREERAKGGRLVGAENVTAGPGHFFTPDVENRVRGMGKRASSLKPPSGKIHQSKGVLFSTGRNKLGPRVTINDALKEARYKSQAEDVKLAHSLSRPFDSQSFDPRTDVLFDPKGASVPRYLQSETVPLDLEDSTPREIAEHWLANRNTWAEHTFPQIDSVPLEHHLGLRVLDKKVAQSIIGRDRYYSAATSNPLGRLLDFGNNVNRAALIYLNPSYIPKNFAGNLGFLALQQGPFAAKNLINASHTLGHLPPETLRLITAESGGGAAVELAHEGRGFLAAPMQKIADVQGAGADRLPRIAAWLWEADRRGYKTEQQINALLHEEKLRPVLTEVSDGAQQAMVKFSRAPASWRRVLSRAIFIFPWVEGATRYVGRLALDRPVSARVAQDIRGRIEGLQKRVFGEGKAVTGGRIPLGAPHGNTVGSFNPMSLSPVGQAQEVANAAKNAATGNYQGTSQLFGFAQPLVNAGFEAATGINTYLGQRYPHGTNALDIAKLNLLGDIHHPAVPLADVAATALRGPQKMPDKPPMHQPNYIPEHGPLAAANKLLFGSARVGFHVPGTHVDVPGVRVNLPAVKAKGRALERAQLSPERKVLATARDLRTESINRAIAKGLLPKGTKHLPPPLREAITLKAKRYANYANLGIKSGSGSYQRDAWAADVKQLRKFGKVTPAQAKDALAWGAKASDKDIRNERAMLGRKYYGGDALSDAAKKLGIVYSF